MVLQPEAYESINRQSVLELHLGMCVLKKDAMDAVIHRSVELGVRKITPLVSEHCTVANKVIKNRRNHWLQAMVAACEQCGLNIVPELRDHRYQYLDGNGNG